MYLSVHLDVVDAPHFAIGARRRRGGSRVSVSGQARDGGTRGVNQKHDKKTQVLNSRLQQIKVLWKKTAFITTTHSRSDEYRSRY